jgi:hypothetical protein
MPERPAGPQTSERHLSRTENCTLTRPKVSTAALHANRIPGQVLALPGPQRHPAPGDEDLSPVSLSEVDCTNLPVVSGLVHMACEHWPVGTPLH